MTEYAKEIFDLRLGSSHMSAINHAVEELGLSEDLKTNYDFHRKVMDTAVDVLTLEDIDEVHEIIENTYRLRDFYKDLLETEQIKNYLEEDKFDFDLEEFENLN